MDDLERELESLSPEQQELLELLLNEPNPARREVFEVHTAETATQSGVAEAWCEVLRVAAVPLDREFLELGGDSLKAIRLLTALRARFDVELSLSALYGSGAAVTVRSVAARIDALREQGTKRTQSSVVCPDPERRHDVFPLTDVQQAYWLGRGSDFELSGVSTHVYEEFDCEDLDVARLERGFERLIDRHDMLRARLAGPGEQRVEPQARGFRIDTVDRRALDQREAAARLQSVREEMSHAVLPADSPPLLDVRVAYLDARRLRLFISLDALFCDAWSVSILFGELQQLYENPELELPPLTLGFRDYVLAARALETKPAYAASLEYWKARLDQLPAGPELPLSDSSACSGPPVFARRRARLAPERWSAFKRSASRAGVTPSCALLAAFSEALARFSKSQRFTLNLTLFNRLPLHEEVDRIVGDFTSLTLLEVDASRKLTFEERARAVQERLWQDLDHRAVSGVRVLRELVRRDPGRNALMPVVFTSTLNPGGEGEHGTTSWTGAMAFLGENVHGVTQTPQVWLDHQVAEEHGALVYNWDAVEALFRPGVLDALWTVYSELLEELAQNDEAWCGPARVRLPPEQRALFERVNATETTLPQGLLHAPFLAQAARAPNAAAVLSPSRQLSYAELDARSTALAWALAGLGAKPNVLVAIVLQKGWEQVVACLAVLKAGAAYLPLDPALPRERMNEIFERAPPIAILTASRHERELACPPGLARLCVDTFEPEPGIGALPACDAKPTDLAYVIFTSGSTGKPKGVMIDHRGALNTVLDVNARFGVDRDDRVLSLSALSFDLSVYDLFGTLAAGGAIVLPDAEKQRDPAHWLALLRTCRVTVWNTVPALMEMLVSHAGDAVESVPLRIVLLSGDWIPVSLPDKVKALCSADVVSLGGATEASIWSIAYRIERVDPAWKSIPYGTALANQRMYVLNSRLEACPVWGVGGIYIGGSGVALGYIGDAERTRERFLEHPETGERLYSTGDLGRMLPDGNIEFLGREDLQVKIQGYRIELEEIEAALLRSAGVTAACVLAVAAPSGGKRLVAHVVPSSPSGFDLDALKATIAHKLPSYMLPAQWFVLDTLPLTANGKVDRAALARPSETPQRGARIARADTRRGPIVALCAELFREPELDVTQSFFALGGDSLLAARLVAKLRDVYAVDLPMQLLFESAALEDVIGEVVNRLSGDAHAKRQVLSRGAQPEAGRAFRLTDVQYAYWLGRAARFGLGGVACQAYIEIDALDIDVERLNRAYERLVARHPMLRAVIGAGGVQTVLTEAHAASVSVADVRNRSSAERAKVLAAERQERSHAVLPLDRAPILRLHVTRIDSRLSRVHLNVDLLVMDYSSFLIFCRELRTLYFDPERALAPLGVEFADYVRSLGGHEREHATEQSLEYWKDRARQLPPAPQLPLIADPEQIARPRFERRKARLELGTPLRARAKAEGLTPSALVLSAFAEILARYAGSPSFTLNVTLFDRPSWHPDLEHVIGDFTTLTLLGVDGTGATFRERARSVQGQLWRDLDHRRVSGVRVLGELSKLRGGPVRMPVVFTSTLRNSVDASEPPLAWLGEEVFSVSQTPQVWLDHQVSQDGEALVVIWDAAAELFPCGLIERMFSEYCELLGRIAADEAAFDSARAAAAALPAPHTSMPMQVPPRARGIEADPARRLAFKMQKPGLRRDLPDRPVALPELELDAERTAAYVRRRSHRSFSAEPVALDSLSGLVGVLSHQKLPGMPLPKALYASAGGLYPVQLYVYVKRDRCAALTQGCYYYHPEQHALVGISDAEVPREAYASVNRGAFESAAFCLYLVLDRAAIEPLYSEFSASFGLLEAGIMTHLLESTASELGLGLCQTGALEFEPLRSLFRLGPNHVFLHALVGGKVEPDACTLRALIAEHAAVAAMLELSAATTAAEPLARAVEGAPVISEISRIWQRLLAMTTVPASASFFEAGGTSLGVVELARALGERFGLEVPVLALFEHTTIAAQAAYLDALLSGNLPANADAPARDSVAPPRLEHEIERRRERLRQGRSLLE